MDYFNNYLLSVTDEIITKLQNLQNITKLQNITNLQNITKFTKFTKYFGDWDEEEDGSLDEERELGAS